MNSCYMIELNKKYGLDNGNKDKLKKSKQNNK